MHRDKGARRLSPGSLCFACGDPGKKFGSVPSIREKLETLPVVWTERNPSNAIAAVQNSCAIQWPRHCAAADKYVTTVVSSIEVTGNKVHCETEHATICGERHGS